MGNFKNIIKKFLKTTWGKNEYEILQKENVLCISELQNI
jgi:hypothetical protein